VCAWELTGTSTGAGARVRPNSEAWAELADLLRDTGPAAPAAVCSDDAGRRLAEGLLDWQQLQLLVEVRVCSLTGTRESELTDLPGSSTAGTQHTLSLNLHARTLLQPSQAGGWSPAGSVTLQAGPPGCLLPARYETHDTLVVQIEGVRRVLLVAPDRAFRGAAPFPVAHPFDGYSCLDFEEPEVEHWPRAIELRGTVVDLHPGDTLLVPAYWFAHTQLMGSGDDDVRGAAGLGSWSGLGGGCGGSAALLVRLQPAAAMSQQGMAAEGGASFGGGRLLSDGALQLQLGRMMEMVVAKEVGAANVRKWLQVRVHGGGGGGEGRPVGGFLVLCQLQCTCCVCTPLLHAAAGTWARVGRSPA